MKERADQRNLYAAERTLLAAERTLLAWSRTSLAFMGFGFVIERFGLYLQMSSQVLMEERLGSFWIGITFIFMGSIIALISVFQHGSILKSIEAADIPKGYSINLSKLFNVLLALLGFLLTLFLVFNFIRT